MNTTTEINFNKVSKILKALSHPMRIKIVKILKDKGEMCVSEIYKTLNLEQSTASHHLGILKASGILSSTRNGKQIYYSINSNNFQQLLQCIEKCSCN